MKFSENSVTIARYNFYIRGEKQMLDCLEIRWHGRGGQGAKTAALLLADVAFKTGKYVQGFPEYGPERMGAPITAYNRISDNPVRVHSNIYNPEYVVVVDESLIGTVDVTKGMREDGAVIINTKKDKTAFEGKLNGFKGNVYTIDAKKISVQCLGRYFPNTPMLAAVVKATNVMPEDDFLREMKSSFQHKFASKPEVVRGNMKALRMSLKEVR